MCTQQQTTKRAAAFLLSKAIFRIFQIKWKSHFNQFKVEVDGYSVAGCRISMKRANSATTFSMKGTSRGIGAPNGSIPKIGSFLSLDNYVSQFYVALYSI